VRVGERPRRVGRGGLPLADAAALVCYPKVGPCGMGVQEARRGPERTTMKSKTYTPEQIVRLLRQVEAGQAEGKTVEEMCRTLGIGDSTYHRWKDQYGGMKTDEVRRLKELERENERLKKLVAELSLDKQILKEAARGNGPAPPDAGRSSGGWHKRWASRNGGSARRGAWPARWSATRRGGPARTRGWSAGCARWRRSTAATATGASRPCGGPTAGGSTTNECGGCGGSNVSNSPGECRRSAGWGTAATAASGVGPGGWTRCGATTSCSTGRPTAGRGRSCRSWTRSPAHAW
jgi:putative transposase